MLVEVVQERSINNKQIDTITETPDLTKPFLDYLQHGGLPDDPEKARRIKTKAPQFVVKVDNYTREETWHHGSNASPMRKDECSWGNATQARLEHMKARERSTGRYPPRSILVQRI